MEEFTLPMPETPASTTFIVPGPIYEENFRFYFVKALWAYARETGALIHHELDREPGPEDPFRLTVEELGKLVEFLPMPVPGRSQAGMIDGYLFLCQTDLKTKCSGEAISELAQAALMEAIKHPPPIRGQSVSNRQTPKGVAAGRVRRPGRSVDRALRRRA